jgi:peptidoglycan/xylan/chitin deacetylase (PgdA/CDA1 family)
MLLVVNYHYIREKQFPYPGIHPLAPKAFRRQIEELGRHFEFISQEDLLAAVDGHRNLPEKACLLTFDDGLKDHYTHAAPVLNDMKIPAVFFISGQPIAENRPLTVHRIHWLRSQIEPLHFQEMVFSGCEQLGISDRTSMANNGIEGKYFWDDLEIRKTKYLLNVLLTDTERERLLNFMEKRAKIGTEEYFERLYMMPRQVAELGRRFAVGTHGYSHTPLGCKNEREIEEDIRLGISALSPMCGPPASISYPYGYEGAVSQAVFEVAKRCGLRAGFTTERSFNLTLEAPLALARVDTNDAPGGKQSIIVPRSDGFDLQGAMTHGRRRFWREVDLASDKRTRISG